MDVFYASLTNFVNGVILSSYEVLSTFCLFFSIFIGLLPVGYFEVFCLILAEDFADPIPVPHVAPRFA